ncbi:hypothetical protein FPOG_01286 [Fusobacterium periodonticum D10]|uniref:Uncharacterized protein n=1 Tax=Fusobacterium periodonticum D10 TaxID=620833 RepID=K1GMS0_9FUSO|nr:hypothetical protein FPOG_01286 [Fusobacterium periodonticum D10]
MKFIYTLEISLKKNINLEKYYKIKFRQKMKVMTRE